MISMDVNHDDIDEFIMSKSDVNKINHANISVRADGGFFELDTEAKRNTMKLIAQNNWETGEPRQYWALA